MSLVTEIVLSVESIEVWTGLGWTVVSVWCRNKGARCRHSIFAVAACRGRSAVCSAAAAQVCGRGRWSWRVAESVRALLRTLGRL